MTSTRATLHHDVRPALHAAVKRTFDIVVATVSLVVLLPVLAVIAAAIVIESGRPVFYRQIRVGRDGATFLIWKFRSMCIDADRIAPNVSPRSDPRVTRVGRILRASYLDEIPQLINVLRGEMSIVGPRPETPEHVALYTAHERRVLDLRPGMAGPSTLGCMDEAERLATARDPARYYVDHLLHERVRLDLTYLKRRSIAYDVGLLARQLVAILRGPP